MNHRKIKVLRESENVIWFDFAALCEGPRSPAGLHRHRQRIPVGVDQQCARVATTPRDNAARRFISVIDEFYDRGVNVIISAAAAPAELYKGEKLKFEFQRTVEPVDRDAERGIPRARASRRVMGTFLIC